MVALRKEAAKEADKQRDTSVEVFNASSLVRQAYWTWGQSDPLSGVVLPPMLVDPRSPTAPATTTRSKYAPDFEVSEFAEKVAGFKREDGSAQKRMAVLANLDTAEMQEMAETEAVLVVEGMRVACARWILGMQ